MCNQREIFMCLFIVLGIFHGIMELIAPRLCAAHEHSCQAVRELARKIKSRGGDNAEASNPINNGHDNTSAADGSELSEVVEVE